jgi:predicted GIY-YIG superfamily endonuclease
MTAIAAFEHRKQLVRLVVMIRFQSSSEAARRSRAAKTRQATARAPSR